MSSEMWMVWIFGFISGAIFGITAVILYAVLKLRSIDKKAKELTDKVKNTLKSMESSAASEKLVKSVKERLTRAFDITEEQLSILGAMDLPQSGPLHGKYKNELNSRLKALEEEKIKVLKSILEDGYNPKLTILNSSTGLKETIPLEEFVKRYDEPADQVPPPPPPPSKPKLRVISNKEKIAAEVKAEEPT